MPTSNDVKTVATPAADQAAKDLIAALKQHDTSLASIQKALKVLGNPADWDGVSAAKFRSGLLHDYDTSLKAYQKNVAQLDQHAPGIKKNIDDIMNTGAEGF
jgi:hypothetical protein